MITPLNIDTVAAVIEWQYAGKKVSLSLPGLIDARSARQQDRIYILIGSGSETTLKVADPTGRIVTTVEPPQGGKFQYFSTYLGKLAVVCAFYLDAPGFPDWHYVIEDDDSLVRAGPSY